MAPAVIPGGYGTGSLPWDSWSHGSGSGFGDHGGYRFDGEVWRPQKLPATPAVGHQVLPAAPAARQQPKGYVPLTAYRPQAPLWPEAAQATVALGAAPAKGGTGKGGATGKRAVGTPVKAAGLPVWLAPAGPGDLHSVQVRVASHDAAARAGANGMLLALTPGTAAAGSVQVVIDYAALDRAYGGGFGSRLQLVELPSCALTTPQLAACRTRQPVAFSNRPAASQLTATVPLATTFAATTGATAETTALALTSGTSGSQGDYTATSLNPSGAWQASGTGAFTYSYPIDVPAAIGGAVPSVGLDYDSQSEDGETTARNSQASWVGDGWSYQPGFVERGYRPCGSLLDSGGAKILKGSGDECWAGDDATLSFGTHSGQLVPDGTDPSVPGEVKQWRLRGDDGTLVQELSGAANGLHDGVYFRVLTMDGTAAYFGADHSPDAAGTAGSMPADPADASTHAAWGVPVLHPVAADPCYSAADGKASQCDKPEGWRWNLDFVVTAGGFVQRYDYSAESDYYDLGGGQAASGDTGTLTSYTRGGALSRISYGYTLADEQAGSDPAAEVDFGVAQRCQTTSDFTDCSASNLKDSTATHWPDVPWDLHCDATDSTKLPDDATSVPADVCITTAPSFWTTTRLDSITTKVHVKATDQLTAVDTYRFGQVYSDAGGTVDPVTGTTVDAKDAGMLQAVMWLQSITHTGKDTYGNGNSDITLNQVSFTGTEIDNRVDDSSPSAPPLYRPRISSVQTETGESIAVEYNSAPCAGKALSIAQADSNAESCYPVYWTVPGASKPIADWFNKVTVHQVAVSDLTVAGLYKPDARAVAAGSETQVSTYSYAGAAWHRDDSQQTDDQYRTWDRFRGFRTVTVQTGAAPEPVTQQTTTFLQGMDGDYKADGTRRSVSVAAHVGGQTVQTVTDTEQLAGTPLEVDTYSKAGGTVTAETVNGPFTYTTTASVSQTPWTDWTQADNPGATEPALSTLPDLVARRLAGSQSHGYALLADGTWRHTRTDTAYDSAGRIASLDEHGDMAVPAQEKCATTDFAAPPAGNTMMLAYPDRLTTVSGPCDTAAGAATLLSDRMIYYAGDGTLAGLGTYGTAGATGRATGIRDATGFTGTTENWRTTSAMAYDGAGRVTDSVDVTGQNTHTDFTPAWSAAGGNTNPTAVATTNSKGWKGTSTFDALRGLPLETVDANGRATEISYDALGRRTAVWLPGRDKSAGRSANLTFSYSINPGAVPAPGGTVTQPGAPSAVTSRTLREDGTYATSVTVYDGMLQPRQTQATPDGDADTGRIVSDTFFDSHGWQVAAYAPYWDPSGTPDGTLYAATENQVPSESTTQYDGQGRAVTSTLWHQAVEQWHTSTSYPGADEADTTAQSGGRSTASFSNALGQTTSSVVRNTGSNVKLHGGDTVPSGTSLATASVRLAMQADGNLVLTGLSSGKTLWSSGTSGNPGAWAKYGTDGNLAVFGATGTQLWSTGLAATTGSVLQVQNDANMVVYNSAGTSVWSSGTYHLAAIADATTRYTYNAAGQLSTVSDTAGNSWSYAYDLLGRRTSQSDPNSGTTTFDKYDAAGNLLQTTDARGQSVSYSYDWDNRRTAEYAGPWSATPDATKELSSWAYDTLAKGLPTSSTRYVGGASGTSSKAYTQAVLGYTTDYQPTGSTLTVPAADGFAAAGQSTAPAAGSVTYTATSRYTPNTGMLSTAHFQADGNLPAEDIDYTYTQQGNLDSIGGFINSSNTPAYLDTAVHDPFGRVQQANYGPTGKELATFAQYDATTGRVTQTSSMLQTSSTALDVVSYRYDQAGAVTAVDDLRDNTTHDTQCFSYDGYQRLTAAWTDTAGISNPSAAVPGAVGGCVTGRVETSGSIPRTTTVGGPAPYWQTYTYDQLGDRTGLVNHDTTGNALADATQAIPYPGADATKSAALPDQAGAATTADPASGTATVTPTYTDPAYGNKNAGSTTTRKVTSTGPLVSAFTLSGGGKKCVEDASSSTTAGSKVQINTCSTATGQKWTVGTDGTVRVVGMCLDTTGNATAAGTKLVIDTCTTDSTQKWKLTSAGTLVSGANPAMCATDPAASATNATQLTLAACGSAGQNWTNAASAVTGAVPAGQTQTFTYDAEGRTATVATGDGTHTDTSSYLYDTDGNLLEQTASVDGTAKTRVLYLFGGAEQITLDVAAKTWTGLRNISGPDGTTVTRSSSGTVTYQVGNAQGTATTAVNAATLAVTRRAFDPYGNPRGAKPAIWVSADNNRGFLGQPTDTASGLDLLGARTYDPGTGRFLTPDPVFQAGDPNQMGGYTYAADNPASSSDPTGFDDWYNDPSMNTCAVDCGTKPPTTQTTPPSSTVTSSGDTVTVNGYTVGGISDTKKFVDKYCQDVQGYFKADGGYAYGSPRQLMADIASALQQACYSDSTCNDSRATRNYLYDIYEKNQEFVFGWDGAPGGGEGEAAPRVSSEDAAKKAETDAGASRTNTAGDHADEGAAAHGDGVPEDSALANKAAEPAKAASEPSTGATGTKAAPAPAPKAIEPAPVRKAIGPSPMAKAQSWQGSGNYPGVDGYRSIMLREGDKVYGGYPFPTEYYTTKDAVAMAAGDATALYEGLQVRPFNGTYRPQVREYTVTQDTQAAYGITEANPQYGSGGYPQVFIPNWKQVLSPGEVTDMKNTEAK